MKTKTEEIARRGGMKLSVEIKDNKLFFEYQIGESKHSAEAGLTPDSLIAFTAMLRLANDSYWSDDTRKKDLLAKMVRMLELQE